MLNLIYDLTLGIPVTLGKQILEGLRDEIDKGRLITEGSVKERLQMIQLQLQEGEITEEQYQVLESQLISRLREIRAYRTKGSN